MRGALLALAVVGCLSCGDAPETSADGQANSRAEIEAVPNWTLAEVPEASVGVLEGDRAELFASIRAGALGPHGMYVLDGSYHEVRVFDQTGSHVMSLGREGDGPGEFRNPTGLVVGRDSTITVWDRGLHRLTVFGHDGEVLRTATVTEMFLNPMLQSVAADGSFVLSDFQYPPTGISEAGVGSVVVTAYSMEGELLDTLGVLTGPQVTGLGGISKPFTNPDLVASDRDGVWLLRVDTALIVRVNLVGDTLQAVTWESPDRDVTGPDLDAFVDFRLERITDPAVRSDRERQLRQPGVAAERHPVASRLETDGVGRLWIVEREDWDQIQSPTWLVFGPEGRVLGRWEEPLESLSLLDADETMALVQVSDDLGVQRIELRRILKGGQPGAGGASAQGGM